MPIKVVELNEEAKEELPAIEEAKEEEEQEQEQEPKVEVANEPVEK